VMSDPPGPSVLLAGIEIVLSALFFFCSIFYVRPAKKAHKAVAKKTNRVSQALDRTLK
jgi:uncharacterized membrane protein